jgi:hypothetical protein
MSKIKSETISNEYLNNKELVYTRDTSGNIQSAGYSINSELMKAGTPIMETKSSNNLNTNQFGGKISERFKDLAIPVGLLLMHQKQINHYTQTNSDEVIDDSLYNKLLSLASENEKQMNGNKHKKTKHSNRKNKSNKKTKKKTRK